MGEISFRLLISFLSNILINVTSAAPQVRSGPQAMLLNTHPFQKNFLSSDYVSEPRFRIEVDGIAVQSHPDDPYFEAEASQLSVKNAVAAMCARQRRSTRPIHSLVPRTSTSTAIYRSILDSDAQIAVCYDEGYTEPMWSKRLEMKPYTFPITPMHLSKVATASPQCFYRYGSSTIGHHSQDDREATHLPSKARIKHHFYKEGHHHPLAEVSDRTMRGL